MMATRRAALLGALAASALAGCASKPMTPEERAAESVRFLAANARREDVLATPSGLQYRVLRAVRTTAPAPTAADAVRVHYEGRLPDGTVFDSSYERGEPAEFALARVIAGWTEGLQLMRPGEMYEFFVPPALAYGERGAGGVIPPNQALIFKVELIEVLAAGE
ncbi:MAG: FKBP-type peptidyl-prolyl cis-trans isomerase [Hydrogenophilaceae bacterium]|jgi:FKBP-type peptidyl-prolyl cis-trans isomerase|nr:FKBP-type peptidyl-prolyl cis-trans isomerase [Hydrogenophilaceae bacterium]